jgi:hypothetical protein
VAGVVVNDKPRQLIGLGVDEASSIRFLPEGLTLAEGRQKPLPEELPVDLNIGKR